uniref:Uncharacterized mitochondrial protein AtMg00810-like n=1 Tax=Nicotiana tabacum TaxID=4097 RepID=A0A1S3X0R3_TOBAC|nr:PREDICTED: uncharacterized mitochondrial protein AtMg00810-like [Nicotiana tabacum]
MKPDGSIERHKARLVAKGYSQLKGIDFAETFSPVVKAITIRVILSFAVTLHWSIRQLDVKNDFLHGHQQEEVYMTQPLGFTDPIRADSSLFTLHDVEGKILLLLYVDDIIITGSNSRQIGEVVQKLGHEFAMKDLEPLIYFLGIKKHGLQEAAGKAVDPSAYRSIVGSLQYLTLTRPDITHVVNLTSQFMQNPNSMHLQAGKRILMYVKGTIDHGLRIISQSSFRLYGFPSADWAGCSITRRSTTGYSIYLGANCVSWSSRK